MNLASPCEHDFALALLDPARPVPSVLRAHNGSDVTVRFNVYRNNVMVSLVQALADSTPVVRQCLGEDVFTRFALRYARRHPPRSAVMQCFGEHWPDFLVDQSNNGAEPWLPDLARLEMARITCFHAADADAAVADDLMRWMRSPDDLAELCLRLHPTVRVIEFAWPVVRLWHCGMTGDSLPRHVQPGRQASLISRVGDDVHVVLVDNGALAFLRALQSGAALADAATDALEAQPDFSLADTLSLLIRQQALTAPTP